MGCTSPTEQSKLSLCCDKLLTAGLLALMLDSNSKQVDDCQLVVSSPTPIEPGSRWELDWWKALSKTPVTARGGARRKRMRMTVDDLGPTNIIWGVQVGACACEQVGVLVSLLRHPYTKYMCTIKSCILVVLATYNMLCSVYTRSIPTGKRP